MAPCPTICVTMMWSPQLCCQDTKGKGSHGVCPGSEKKEYEMLNQEVQSGTSTVTVHLGPWGPACSFCHTSAVPPSCYRKARPLPCLRRSHTTYMHSC